MSIQPSLPGDRTVSPVPSDEAGRRLDRYLASVLSDMSRTSIQQLIADGAILVNGQASKAGYMLRTGDEIQLVSLAPKAATSKVRPQFLPLDIVYEDEDVLVVNKAAGMGVHPAPGDHDDTLVKALLAFFPDFQGIGAGGRPGVLPPPAKGN